MTDETQTLDNVVSLADFRNKKLEKEKLNELRQLMKEEDDGIIEFDPSSIDSINDLCADTVNELFDFMELNYDLVLPNNASAVELILFLEAYKSLVLKAVDKWHPFQDLASKIFAGVKLEEDENGYKYVFENIEKI